MGPRPLPVLLAALVLVTAAPVSAAPASAAPDPVVVAAAGDIACQGSPCPPQRRTARLVEAIDPDAVLTLGDHQYERGRLRAFRASYDPTWGRFVDRTFPVPGNHEYYTPNARGYFRYFGESANGPRGFTSFELGDWLVLAMNSERLVDRQRSWARDLLDASDATCEIAYWHRPRWSSGASHGSDPSLRAWWNLMVRRGVDIVLSGHEHQYERFARLSERGRKTGDGTRQFVVGTGGIRLYPFGRALRGSQRRIVAHGVLRLELFPDRYTWRFHALGKRDDRGDDRCRVA